MNHNRKLSEMLISLEWVTRISEDMTIAKGETFATIFDAVQYYKVFIASNPVEEFVAAKIVVDREKEKGKPARLKWGDFTDEFLKEVAATEIYTVQELIDMYGIKVSKQSINEFIKSRLTEGIDYKHCNLLLLLFSSGAEKLKEKYGK